MTSSSPEIPPEPLSLDIDFYYSSDLDSNSDGSPELQPIPPFHDIDFYESHSDSSPRSISEEANKPLPIEIEMYDPDDTGDTFDQSREHGFAHSNPSGLSSRSPLTPPLSDKLGEIPLAVSDSDKKPAPVVESDSDTAASKGIDSYLPHTETGPLSNRSKAEDTIFELDAEDTHISSDSGKLGDHLHEVIGNQPNRRGLYAATLYRRFLPPDWNRDREAPRESTPLIDQVTLEGSTSDTQLTKNSLDDGDSIYAHSIAGSSAYRDKSSATRSFTYRSSIYGSSTYGSSTYGSSTYGSSAYGPSSFELPMYNSPVYRHSAFESVAYDSADAYKPSASENQGESPSWLPDVVRQQLPQQNEANRAVLNLARRKWSDHQRSPSTSNASPGLSNLTRPSSHPTPSAILWSMNRNMQFMNQDLQLSLHPPLEAENTTGVMNSEITREHNELVSNYIDQRQLVHVCKWSGCGRSFSRQSDCERHEQLHSNYPIFTCEGCQKTFAGMDALIRHLRSDIGTECAKVHYSGESGATDVGSDQVLNTTAAAQLKPVMPKPEDSD